MKREFEELQNPPKEFIEGLVEANDDKIRKNFLSNTMTYNNAFAFASVQNGGPCPEDQLGGRKDTCKYNGNNTLSYFLKMILKHLGEFSFLFSDLISPEGRRPTFAQVYTLTPEDACKLRKENLSNILKAKVKQEILQRLDELMRDNPFGKTFVTAGKMIEDAKEKNNGEVPHFQVIIFIYFYFTILTYFSFRSFCYPIGSSTLML